MEFVNEQRGANKNGYFEYIKKKMALYDRRNFENGERYGFFFKFEFSQNFISFTFQPIGTFILAVIRIVM